MTEDFMLSVSGGQVPARFITLDDGSPGVEVEGVAFAHETAEVPHGLVAHTDDARRKLDDLRRRFQITSEASVFPFDVQEHRS
ncbi:MULTISPECIES: hypothetical protein [Deinococcus]|uniref:Uncharacterized protein n=1 Tax=Deinococcus rufus TaxID=2136097 RepID=A0ABV7ZE86_9DEIO|nr:hypothetical protein [Deinococcus sp. AB2017081]WQE97017.1 hypothetical protein U2P90_08970 [Deinococcus sp. AB2017081]